MKRIAKYFTIITAAVAGLSSCSTDFGDEPAALYTATVTFKPNSDGTYYLQENDSTVLFVTNSNMKEYPFKVKKERRAMVKYYETKAPVTNALPHPDRVKYAKNVAIMALDTIHTKNPVAYDETKDYGKDAMGLYLGYDVFPTTLIEDGYLNLSFTVPMTTQRHDINIVYGANPDDPYELMATHNNNGAYGAYQRIDYLMSFPLKDLNVPEGKKVVITLKWKSLVSGQIESVKIPYTGRTDW